MLITVVNILILNILQKYVLLEIRCGVLLDCRGHQRDRIPGAALLGRERCFRRTTLTPDVNNLAQLRQECCA